MEGLRHKSEPNGFVIHLGLLWEDCLCADVQVIIDYRSRVIEGIKEIFIDDGLVLQVDPSSESAGFTEKPEEQVRTLIQVQFYST